MLELAEALVDRQQSSRDNPEGNIQISSRSKRAVDYGRTWHWSGAVPQFAVGERMAMASGGLSDSGTNIVFRLPAGKSRLPLQVNSKKLFIILTDR